MVDREKMAIDVEAWALAIVDTPVTWGVDDCSAWPAAWIEHATGIKVPVPHYASQAEAEALIAKAGGLLPLWIGLAAGIGMWRTDEPQAGDVGIIETDSFGQVGVVWGPRRVALWRSLKGVLGMSVRQKYVVATWSIESLLA